MIKRIEQINNLGRFENFSATGEFGNNTIIFGFNGAGKSTLSDIFYSLSKDNTDEYLSRRRTLNREGETGEKKIDIIISSDDGPGYIFSGDAWNNRPQKLFVFNEKYIEEHVFVSEQVEGNVVPIAMGTQGVNLLRQKVNLENSNKELLVKINNDIGILTEAGLKIKDFSSTKVSNKTAKKRFVSMATFSLYPISNESAIRERLRKNEVYSLEIDAYEKCNKLYESIKNVELISITNVFKKIERVPRISSKELALFLENTLTSVDLKWAVRGYQNQKDKKICPMCGQDIVDKQAIVFFCKLGKYISQGKNDHLSGFSKELSTIASQLSGIRISDKISNFVKIVYELDAAKLLLKKDANRLQKGLSWTDVHSQHIDTLITKIYEKSENPYLDIEVSEEEKASLKLLNAVISNIIVLGDILEGVKVRIEEKNARNFVKEEVGKICELSYGSSGS